MKNKFLDAICLVIWWGYLVAMLVAHFKPSIVLSGIGFFVAGLWYFLRLTDENN